MFGVFNSGDIESDCWDISLLASLRSRTVARFHTNNAAKRKRNQLKLIAIGIGVVWRSTFTFIQSCRTRSKSSSDTKHTRIKAGFQSFDFSRIHESSSFIAISNLWPTLAECAIGCQRARIDYVNRNTHTTCTVDKSIAPTKSIRVSSPYDDCTTPHISVLTVFCSTSVL